MEELPATAGELIRAQVVLLNQESDEDLRQFSGRVDQVLKAFPRSRIIAIMSAGAANENLEGTQNKRYSAVADRIFLKLKV